MGKRIVIGAGMILVLAGTWYLDARVLGAPRLSRILLWTTALIGLGEVLAIGARRVETNPGLRFYGAVAVVAIVTPYVVAGAPVPGALIVLAAVFAGGVRLVGMAPLRSAAGAFPEALLLAAGICYVAGLASFLDRIVVVGGVTTAYAVVAVSKTSDICGYLVGKTIGRKRIAPAMSPKKTWEGTIAGVLGSIGVAVLLAPELGPGLPAWLAALIGGLLGVSSFLGDLIESGLKRWADVKDSASLVPEFGGVLDMLDGVLVAAPVAAVCLYGG